jgi:SAM-dependent methyltransferase
MNNICSWRYLLIFILLSQISCTGEKNRTVNEKPVQSPVMIHEDSVDDKDFEEQIKEYEAKDRDEWQHPEVILNSLGNLKGKKIADIGAGTGYFSFKLALKADSVFAIDIDPRFIDYIEERKESFRDGIGENVVTILASPDDPKLAPRKVDLVLMVNTYSYLEDRVNYLKKIKDVINKQSEIAIVDFKEKNSPVGPPNNLKISAKTAVQELEEAGFAGFKVDTLSLPYQYIIKARNK